MKKKKKPAADNGVSLSYKVEVNERIKIPFLNDILLTLLVMMATVGAVMTLVTILDLRVMPHAVIPCIAGFSVLYTVLYTLVKKRRWLVMVGAVVLAGLIVLLFYKDFAKGVAILYDQAREYINEFSTLKNVTERYEWRGEYYLLTNAVMIVFSMVLCSAISYFTVVQQRFIPIFLLTFPCFEIGALYGAVPNYRYFSLMAASWAASLTVSRAANAKIKTRRVNGKKQNRKVNGATQKFAGIAVVIAAMIVILFTSAGTCLEAINFTRAENLDRLRNETKIVYEDLVDYLTGIDHDGSLKEGKLYDVDDRVVKNRHYLTLETNIPFVEYPVVIKGYTGANYYDNSWHQLDTYEEYKAMFDRFAASSYKMGVDTGELLTSVSYYDKLFVADLTLSEFRRKKPYLYEVYFADLSGFSAVHDSYVVPKNKREYSYTACLSEWYVYDVIESDVYKSADYQAAFKEYTEFVKQEYRGSDIPDSVKELAMSFNAKTQYDYINAVRHYLKDNIEHTVESGKCPQDADFVENFLFNTKKGYSTHFATAAALLFEAKGYPTRYVEGYYIPSDRFNKAPTEHKLEYKTINVTDEYAHAWVEIFDDTYGWIPVEVTPDYWTEDLLGPKPPSQTENDEPEEDPSDSNGDGGSVTPSLDGETGVGSVLVDDEVDNEVDWAPEQSPFVFPTLIVVLSSTGAVLALLVTVTVIVAIRKHRAFASRDVNQKLKFAYRYFVKLAAYQQVKIGNICDYRALAAHMGAKSSLITTAQLTAIFDVFLKHVYSRTPATLTEADEVLHALRAYSHAIYAGLPWYKKVVHRFLKNLY